jgi:hypothetical protein
LIVDADIPARPSEIRTTLSAPSLGRFCAVTKASTSTGVTSTGSLSTTLKKTFKSCA